MPVSVLIDAGWYYTPVRSQIVFGFPPTSMQDITPLGRPAIRGASQALPRAASEPPAALRHSGDMPSSVIRNWHYDVQAQQLDVLFVSGRRYRYHDVPPAIAAELDAAES